MATNPNEVWSAIKTNVKDAVKSYFPYETRTRKLVLGEVEIDDKIDPQNLLSQEEARLTNKTWGVPVYGNVSLIDKTTGKVMDKKRVKLMTLPKITPRFGYIVDGSEWQVGHLWTLKSGVYANIKDNGVLNAEFNLAAPFARENRLHIPFDPNNRKFKLKFATSNIPLYSVLKSQGVQDEDMKKAWGEEIYKANVSKNPERDILNFYSKISSRGYRYQGAREVDYDIAASAITKAFLDTKLLPETTLKVLGKGFTVVNGDALLRASTKILAISRGEAKADDRNSLVFKELLGVEDFLKSQLSKPGAVRKIHGKFLNNIDRKDKVEDIVFRDMLNKTVKEFFTGSDISSRNDQTNPLDMIAGHTMTTIFGREGGIRNEQALKPAMKMINPSHLGFLDPVHTPESDRTGITLHLPLGVKKVGKVPKVLAYDTEKKDFVRLGPAELHAENIVLPDQVTWKDRVPKPISRTVKMKDPDTHDIVEKPFSKGRYVLTNSKGLFDASTNMIPFLQNNQGNRTMVASKQMSQSVPLLHREAPLVQVQGHRKGESWSRFLGKQFSHSSPVDGKVTSISRDEAGNAYEITIAEAGLFSRKKRKISLYNNFPLNDSRSFFSSTLKVDVGDVVKKGQLVADTNFTKDGDLALGTNLRVGYISYKGYNFEDGIVISESAAEKLTSEHLHRMTRDLDPKTDSMSKEKFTAYAATTANSMTKDQAAKLGSDGVIQIGQTVEAGDVLIAAVGKQDISGQKAMMNSRLKGIISPLRDRSLTWDHEYPGKVVKVIRHPRGKGATVLIRTEQPAQVGDKLVGRHGNKGIIALIKRDDDMPKIGGIDGKHIEVALNPSGIVSRINLGQMLETAAAKIADKDGKPYIVENFPGPKIPNYTEKIKADLKAKNLTDWEILYDPDTKKPLGGKVLTGPQYIMKLTHQGEKKLTARSYGPNYSLDLTPSGGGKTSAQAMDQLGFYTMLAHGARANIREMATYKAEQQKDRKMSETDFWDRIMTNRPLPTPKPTFAYRKFESLLKGLGVNIKKEGNILQLVPLTDKGVKALSGGAIKDGAKFFRGKDVKELVGGLFDIDATGGLPNAPGKGLKWSHFNLTEPMPNPVFVGTGDKVGPAVSLTGLKYSEFEAIARGQKEVNGKTGGAAIKELLSKIDVQKELETVKNSLPNLKGTELDRANRKLRYLGALDNLGMDPVEAYIMHKLPILPPVFRPVAVLPDGNLRYDDLNGLYKNIAHLNDKLKDHPKELPEDTKNPLREQLYDAVKATWGIGATPIYDSNRKLRGILETIKGDKPKEGFFQKKIMRRRQELSMRSTIIPEPNMALDRVGIPRDPAMALYKPFVIRELRSRYGFSPLQAKKAIKEKRPSAWNALERVIEDRPVLLKRDPALHKFSIQAFKPQLVEGRAIKIHPLVTSGFNADFDGDTMSVYVPLTEQAKREALKMRPSNNLFSPTHGGIMYAPTQESLMGLYLKTEWKDKKTLDKKAASYPNFEAAKRALKSEAIEDSTPITIRGKQTTVGRLAIVEALPAGFKDHSELLHNPKYRLNKKNMKKLLSDLAKAHPRDYGIAVNKLKDIGNDKSYTSGYSFTLDDLKVPTKKRDAVLAKYHVVAKKIRASKSPSEVKDKKLVDLYTKATDELATVFRPMFAASGNKLYEMSEEAKARGSWAQFRQMTLAPMLMQDATNRTLPTPVTRSYAEGLDIGDYWTAMNGARKGTVQRSAGTSKPGELSKKILNLSISNMIVKDDCGTSNGIHMSLDARDVMDRILATAAKAGNKSIVSAGTVITPAVYTLLRKNKINKVLVRSPLKCTLPKGLCATCYGLNEKGSLHGLGVNIGVISGQAMGEPSTQLAMNAFHTGGTAQGAGAQSVDQFTRLEQLLSVPKKLPGSATLATSSGGVQKVEKDLAAGGWNIYVGGKSHYVPSNRRPTVKRGSEVRKGQPMSSGPINPIDLLKLTDISTVQNYITGELDNLYSPSGVKRRNIEVIVRSLTNLSKVSDPGDSHYTYGDVIPRSIIEDYNRKKTTERPVKHLPILRRIEDVALDQHEDWLSRLNFQHLQNTVLEGAAQGWKTDLHGTNPLAAYAYGAEFGLGTPEAPYKY